MYIFREVIFISSNIGLILKKLRKSRNLTLDSVAEYFGTTKATISRYETGKHVPDVQLLIKMSKYYDVSMDYIVGINENIYTSLELAIINKIQKLNNANQNQVLGMINYMLSDKNNCFTAASPELCVAENTAKYIKKI